MKPYLLAALLFATPSSNTLHITATNAVGRVITGQGQWQTFKWDAGTITLSYQTSGISCRDFQEMQP